MPYGITSYILVENGIQLLVKHFLFLLHFPKAKYLTTIAYYPQKNGQDERYYRTRVAKLHHHVAEHHGDWDMYVQPLTYAYNSQTYRAIGT